MIAAAISFFIAGFCNALMDRSRDGKHEKTWLFQRQWVIEFRKPATFRVLGIVPWDFWHAAKFLMWVFIGMGIGFLLLHVSVPVSWWQAFAYGLGGMLILTSSFTFWYHGGLYRDVLGGLAEWFLDL